jgi:hypothetical protein
MLLISNGLCIDLCHGHVMRDTCLMKYRLDSSSYIMILQPLPSDFDLIIGLIFVVDINIIFK